MEKVLKSKTKVRFQDCDPFNHLNNGKYLDYFMNAREDQLLEYYGLDIYKIAQETQKSWVVVSNQIAYFKPALLMEPIIIESQLINFTPKSIQIELRMFNEKQTELKAVNWVNFVHYDLTTQKATNHSDEFMNLFGNVVFPLDIQSFEERTATIHKTLFQSLQPA
ncbi:thioesterase [bacterium 336/3]|nr:thioesterase [bacterium 336/3]